jgi:hypothetical protein
LKATAMRKRRRCRGIISLSFFCSPMAIYSDVNREVGETCPESRVGASSSSSGDDVVDPVSLEEDGPWWKCELCSGCWRWIRRMRCGRRSWPMRLGDSVLGLFT